MTTIVVHLSLDVVHVEEEKEAPFVCGGKEASLNNHHLNYQNCF